MQNPTITLMIADISIPWCPFQHPAFLTKNAAAVEPSIWEKKAKAIPVLTSEACSLL